MLFASFPAVRTQSYTAKCTQEMSFKAQSQNSEKRLLLHTHKRIYMSIYIYMYMYIYIYIYILCIAYRKAGLIGFVWKDIASGIFGLFAPV